MSGALDLSALTADDIDVLRAAQAEERLVDFIRYTWAAVEPSRPFISGWALEAICEHLEGVTKGHISRLIINCAPGMSKSLTTQVFWPAWEWARAPATRYVCVSYSSALTERDNGRMCQLIHSPIYRKHWGDKFDANESRVKIINNRTGWKLATSVSGVGTGERGDRVVLDDLISVKQADSSVIREVVQRYVRETLPTRMNDPQGSAIIAIEQRTNEGDTTGTLLADGGDYTHLMIPMEWDGRRFSTPLGWSDPRTIEDIEPERSDREWWAVKGELCFPERFPAWVVERDKRAMGPYAVSSQFQQMPAPRGGGIIQRDWWQRWEPQGGKALFPVFDLVIAFFDGASALKTMNDPSAMAVLGTFTDPLTGMPKVMVVRVWAERLALNDAVKRIDETCLRYRVNILLVENKATGHSVVQELHRLMVGKPYSVVLSDPRGSVTGQGGYDKVSRAMSVVPLFEDGMVYGPCVVVSAPGEVMATEFTGWMTETVEEMAVFPRGNHDDRVDCVVGCLRWLRDAGVLRREVEAVTGDREVVEAEDRRLEPLYRL